ncbi:hypothetical protein LguiA_036480 [Lonicera macranthoides]
MITFYSSILTSHIPPKPVSCQTCTLVAQTFIVLLIHLLGWVEFKMIAVTGFWVSGIWLDHFPQYVTY